jgi:predicted transcriptional regulator
MSRGLRRYFPLDQRGGNPYFPLMKEEPMTPQERDQKIRAMRAERYSLRDIGRELGISHERVRQEIERMNRGHPPGRRPNHVQERTATRTARLVRWNKMGITAVEAAWLLGVEPTAIAKYVQRHNIDMPSGSIMSFDRADRWRFLLQVWNDELREKE